MTFKRTYLASAISLGLGLSWCGSVPWQARDDLDTGFKTSSTTRGVRNVLAVPGASFAWSTVQLMARLEAPAWPRDASPALARLSKAAHAVMPMAAAQWRTAAADATPPGLAARSDDTPTAPEAPTSPTAEPTVPDQILAEADGQSADAGQTLKLVGEQAYPATAETDTDTAMPPAGMSVSTHQDSGSEQGDAGEAPVSSAVAYPLYRNEEPTVAVALSDSAATPSDRDDAERLAQASPPDRHRLPERDLAEASAAEALADAPAAFDSGTLERLAEVSPVVAWHMSADAATPLTAQEAADVLTALATADTADHGPHEESKVGAVIDAVGPLDLRTMERLGEVLPTLAWHMSKEAPAQLTPVQAADVLAVLVLDEIPGKGASQKPQNERPVLGDTSPGRADLNKPVVPPMSDLPATQAEFGTNTGTSGVPESLNLGSPAAIDATIQRGPDEPSTDEPTERGETIAFSKAPVVQMKEVSKAPLVEMAMQRAAAPISPQAAPAAQSADTEKPPLIERAMQRADAPISPQAAPAAQSADTEKPPLIERAMQRAARAAEAQNAPAASPSPVATVVELRPAGRVPPVADAQEREPFLGDKLALSGDQLDELRGGFETNTGLLISFGIDQAVFINGNLVTTTSINIPDVNKIVSDALASTAPDQKTSGVSAAPGAPSPAQKTLTLIQNGQGNTFQVGSTPLAGLATVIQNTLNNQKIQTLTSINATVNSAELLRALNLQSLLRDALGDSTRR